MKLLYEHSTKNWWHHQADVQLTFGRNKTLIPYRENQKATVALNVNILETRNIVTVGLLTTANSKHESGLGGNLPLFRSLHIYLLQHGILSYVVTTEDVLNETNCGYVYCTTSKKWQQTSVPLPHIMYNRIPLRSFELSHSFEQLKRQLAKQHIMMFNPCFIDKYEMYVTFRQHALLKQLLPQTRVITNIQSLSAFLHVHQTIYVEPRDGNRGSGIYTVTLTADHRIEVQSPYDVECFPTLLDYWNRYSDSLQAKKYIAQQAIIPKKKDGHRYDYRLLVHYEQGRFMISGKAVRMSQSQEITTHVPKGGKLYPYESVTTPTLDQQLTEIAQACGSVLSKQLGFIGEFSIDLGENEGGDLYIYEVNSKPMQFDERKIEANRLFQLKNLFIELTDST